MRVEQRRAEGRLKSKDSTSSCFSYFVRRRAVDLFSGRFQRGSKIEREITEVGHNVTLNLPRYSLRWILKTKAASYRA